MINQHFLPSVKTALTMVVILGFAHELSQTANGATFRMFKNDFVEKNAALPIVSPENFVSNNLYYEFLVAQEPAPNVSESNINYNLIAQTVSGQSTLSFDWIMSSLREVNLNATRGDEPIPEVPVLPQVDAADVYKEIYDFGATSAQELSNPVSTGILPPLPNVAPVNRIVRTAGPSNPGISGPRVTDSSLPRFGGPIQIIGKPLESFATPLRQASVPSATPVRTANWGDGEVDVFFASLPQSQIADVDTFMRTIYRTNPTEMVEQIEKALDLTVDTQFRLMPSDIFPENRLPSGTWQGNL
ncbi:hypothetical protein VB715_04800 [Crocosphaera sp. UHCC 0190]|uniref:hypothetical protein n=1 Tax=Crocosphaera sp. UHCC 0190 TaxID=3110246 RepID=UPI002B1F9E3A|nr:hypothetical protein [Crocosphaera sp. UHCC 0190]MEA5509077.1 hypothetical protein [Crocosphaera sp. UHCC 0190]